MNTYNNINELKPNPGKEIQYIDADGNHGCGIYLCNCCKSEWRDIFTGGAIYINVIKWKYYKK